MIIILKENVKWIILGVSIVLILTSFSSCQIAFYERDTLIGLSAIKNGYVQQRSGSVIIWNKPISKE
jgi:hypothetical protein